MGLTPAGTAGLVTGWKAQWEDWRRAGAAEEAAGTLAPDSIHLVMVARSASERRAPAGGIIKPFSLDLRRARSLLSAGLPGTTTGPE